jgi:ribosome-binding factor A
MRPFSRSDRVGGLIQQVLSDILRKHIKDPRLEMTTISAVKMSSDLKIAKIYYTAPSGEKNREATAAGFKDAAGFIKRTLGREVNLRYMPELRFFLDDSFDYGSNIDKLLASLKTENEHDTSSSE